MDRLSAPHSLTLLVPLFAGCLILSSACSAELPVDCLQPRGMAELPPYCARATCNADGQCDPGESCSGCPQDCGSCATESWQQVPSPTRRDLYAVRGSGADDVWAVGQRGAVLRFLGGDWELVPCPTEEDLFDLWSFGPDELWVVGAGGTVLHLREGQWTKAHDLADLSDATTGEAPLYASIAAAHPDDVWIVPAATLRIRDYDPLDVALHYKGAEWFFTVRPSCYACTSSRVATAADSAWILRGRAAPQRWDGQSWADVLLPGAGDHALFGLWPGATGVWVAGERSADAAGVILRWDGATWQEYAEPIPTAHRCRGVWGSGQDVWFVCLGGAVLRHDGTSWSVERRASQAPGLLAVWGSSASDLWAVGIEGTILRRRP